MAAAAEGAPASGRTLYVGGLDEAVTLAVLKAAFIPFGELRDVQVPLEHTTQKNRGFGFVEFEDAADAAEAQANMDNAELFGRTIRVNVAKPSGKKGQAVWSEASAWYESLKAQQTSEEGEEGAAAPAAAGSG